MKLIAIVALFVITLITACGAQPSPAELRTQATIAAAHASGMVAQANEIERQQREARQTAASFQATMNAPTATSTAPPTWTPQPTSTATMTPAPTMTPEPTATQTMQPTVTASATMEPSATPAPARGRTVYDDWPLLLLLGLGALVMVVVLWRLIDGKTITLPGNKRRDD